MHQILVIEQRRNKSTPVAKIVSASMGLVLSLFATNVNSDFHKYRGGLAFAGVINTLARSNPETKHVRLTSRSQGSCKTINEKDEGRRTCAILIGASSALASTVSEALLARILEAPCEAFENALAFEKLENKNGGTSALVHERSYFCDPSMLPKAILFFEGSTSSSPFKVVRLQKTQKSN